MVGGGHCEPFGLVLACSREDRERIKGETATREPIKRTAQTRRPELAAGTNKKFGDFQGGPDQNLSQKAAVIGPAIACAYKSRGDLS